jgi:hypothetical protein
MVRLEIKLSFQLVDYMTTKASEPANLNLPTLPCEIKGEISYSYNAIA